MTFYFTKVIGNDADNSMVDVNTERCCGSVNNEGFYGGYQEVCMRVYCRCVPTCAFTLVFLINT